MSFTKIAKRYRLTNPQLIMNKDSEKWNYAIEKSGFYFIRAKYLKMKAPSHETVDAFEKDFDTLTEYEQKLVSDYHSAFKDAEAQAATAF